MLTYSEDRYTNTAGTRGGLLSAVTRFLLEHAREDIDRSVSFCGNVMRERFCADSGGLFCDDELIIETERFCDYWIVTWWRSADTEKQSYKLQF